MKVLALSTSAPRGSVALLDGGRVLGAASYDGAQGHAERLFQAIDDVLAAAGVARTAIDVLACDIGPGSFTGVRVAVAAAKGIAYARSIRVVGVVSLEAMAVAARAESTEADGVVLAVIDARKGELFVGAYGPGGEPVSAPAHVPAASLPGVIASLDDGKLTLAVPALLSAGLARTSLMEGPDAIFIGRAAQARASLLDAEALVPLYVRAPDISVPRSMVLPQPR
jgi:tRNA threonylcarbamoyladenosine biosynthesis protein TsaB